MTAYDLYGFLVNDIHEAKRILETAIGVTFEARDSEYQGGEYFRWGSSSTEHFVIKVNLDPYDDEPAEMLFPDYPVLFYVNHTLRSEFLKEKILSLDQGFSLLKHKEWS